MTNERACANETLQRQFISMRDSALEVISLLYGIDALVQAGDDFEVSINAITERARELTRNLKNQIEEISQ